MTDDLIRVEENPHKVVIDSGVKETKTHHLSPELTASFTKITPLKLHDEGVEIRFKDAVGVTEQRLSNEEPVSFLQKDSLKKYSLFTIKKENTNERVEFELVFEK